MREDRKAYKEVVKYTGCGTDEGSYNLERPNVKSCTTHANLHPLLPNYLPATRRLTSIVGYRDAGYLRYVQTGDDRVRRRSKHCLDLRVSAFPLSSHNANCLLRLVCSSQSAPPSLSMSSLSLSWTPANGRRRTCGPLFSASTNPLLQTNTLPFPRHGVPPRRSFQPRSSCTQVCSCLFWSICCDVGQIVAEPIPLPCMWIGD